MDAGAAQVEAWTLQGLQFDELSKIRVLAAEPAQQAADLRDICAEFAESKHLFWFQNNKLKLNLPPYRGDVDPHDGRWAR